MSARVEMQRYRFGIKNNEIPVTIIGDSNSIKNQKAMLGKYAQEHGYKNPQFYVDDGYSGVLFDRPAFQEMMQDITQGTINCVIVKDLSRLSRNYTDAGNLIENLFVRLNVRFISLAEGVDSYRNPDSVSNIIVPITNVMNDQYCYQTSKKIRQVFDYKRRNASTSALLLPMVI